MGRKRAPLKAGDRIQGVIIIIITQDVCPPLPTGLTPPHHTGSQSSIGVGLSPGTGGGLSLEDGRGFAKVEVERNWGVLACSLQETVLKQEVTAVVLAESCNLEPETVLQSRGQHPDHSTGSTQGLVVGQTFCFLILPHCLLHTAAYFFSNAGQQKCLQSPLCAVNCPSIGD